MLELFNKYIIKGDITIMKASLYLIKYDYCIEPRYTIVEGKVIENQKSVFDKGVCFYEESQIENYIIKSKLSPKRITKAKNKYDIYFRNRKRHDPDWVSFWSITETIKQQSADAVVFLVVDKRIFAICHGRSNSLLNPYAIVRNFGLITALNAVDPGEISSADTFTPSDIALQKRTKSGKGTRFKNYEVNIFNTLLKNITGKAKKEYKHIISTIEGSDNFKINVSESPETVISNIGEINKIFKLEDYKRGDFKWVDNFQSVKDKIKISELDKILADMLSREDASISLFVPTNLDYAGTICYKVSGVSSRKSKIFNNLDIKSSLYSQLLQERKIISSIDDLEGIRVSLVDYSDNKKEIDSFSLYNCIYTEIQNETEWYFIESGIWYVVKKEFTQNLETVYNEAYESAINIPIKYSRDELLKKYNKSDSKKDKFENWFNQELNLYFSSLGYVSQCLDADNLQMSRYDKVEICDLLYMDNEYKYFFHNKYNNGSAVLSHLFSQANVAAELLMQEEFRKKVNGKIESEKLKLEEDRRFDPRKCIIIYGIISRKNEEGIYSIPLFSKINFMIFDRNIRNKGFDVKICFFEEKI